MHASGGGRCSSRCSSGGRWARLNFPDEIPALVLAEGGTDDGMLSAASIRKKAIEMVSRVDALQTGLMVTPPHHRGAPEAPPPPLEAGDLRGWLVRNDPRTTPH
ncbi:hypothetical protein PAHAL_5G169900 [Panicum hallii]|uniref:Uncharacterized protein n=1 Tax=Panicum hallii TaxID=206008 RepID=A0A2T8IK66_9POAL|nr:hypothetical protein PAHAL_5G169900 [Panicum hallii]